MTERRGSSANRLSTVLARQLGSQLLAFRDAAGLNQSAAAEVLSAQAAKVAKMERGWVPFRDPDIIALCKLYGVEDEAVVASLIRLAKLDRERRRAKGWWNALDQNNLREYIAMEDVASLVRTWQLSFVPGLFQTPQYARSLAVSEGAWIDPDEIERVVEVRTRRQARLGGEAPLEVYAVVWEAALRQQVGGPEVMRGQMERLLEVAELPNVRLQVLPYQSGGHPCMASAFNIVSFAETESVDVVHVDTITSTLWVENEEDSSVYSTFFDRTARKSLAPKDSLSLIQNIGKGMHS
ncbi:helix-turn-helix domain-containing protein [Streptomyces sp. NPDC059092]|uniref:helix-turn-helix domain-containing protein n=1 Tax=Streptomyces sp. NPDC059092 TaxID=3346725 RepID=UPI00368DA505